MKLTTKEILSDPRLATRFGSQVHAAKSPATVVAELPTVKAKGRRHTPGEMNKLEQRYAGHLELRRAAGEVLWYAFEVATFKIAHDCRYTADFLVMLADASLEVHEVKPRAKGGGYWAEEDARIKVKVAARAIPLAFRVCWPNGDDSGWVSEEVRP